MIKVMVEVVINHKVKGYKIIAKLDSGVIEYPEEKTYPSYFKAHEGIKALYHDKVWNLQWFDNYATIDGE